MSRSIGIMSFRLRELIIRILRCDWCLLIGISSIVRVSRSKL